MKFTDALPVEICTKDPHNATKPNACEYLADMKIIAFGASTSSTSINRQLAAYVASQFKNGDVEVLDLNDFELPLFSVNLEKEIGKPKAAQAFVDKLKSADLLVISLAEHNGSYSAAFKNLFDWASRYELKMFESAPVFLLATSTGKGGGRKVLESGVYRFPKHGAEILATFSLPEFKTNFDAEKGIVDEELKAKLNEAIEAVETAFT